MLAVLESLREAARAAMPADAYAYFESGAGDEVATREAEAAWLRYRVVPRVLQDVSEVDLSVDILGSRFSTPIAVAPTAFHALAHADAELATIRGAGRAGALTVISTRASKRLEDIAAEATAPWWFQVYMLRERRLTQALVERAVAGGAAALVLTVDTPYVGRKTQLHGSRMDVGDEQLLVNLGQHMQAGADVGSAIEQDPTVSAEAISWLHEIAGVPVLVKGVLRGDDALRCLEAGSDGIIVSNHGGRQSPRAVSTAAALPQVVAAVDGAAPVLVDGGIRCGTDALVALALGAKAVLLGRPILWGLAAEGADGVLLALNGVTDDLRHALALAGTNSLDGLTRSAVADC